MAYSRTKLHEPGNWSVFKTAAGEWVAVECQYEDGNLVHMRGFVREDGRPMRWPKRVDAVNALIWYHQENRIRTLEKRLAQAGIAS